MSALCRCGLKQHRNPVLSQHRNHGAAAPVSLPLRYATAQLWVCFAPAQLSARRPAPSPCPQQHVDQPAPSPPLPLLTCAARLGKEARIEISRFVKEMLTHCR
eukprot:g53826.t1